MNDFAMLKDRVRNGQINVGVPSEVEDAYFRLKRDSKINMPEEVRRAVIEAVRRIESALAQGPSKAG